MDKQPQRYCSNCDRPINQNCYHSLRMDGQCNKCYNMYYTKTEKTLINKKMTKHRKNQRKFKFESQNFMY